MTSPVLVPPMPPLWRSFVEVWCRLDTRLGWAWWVALQRASWSQAVTFRTALRACDGRRGRLSTATANRFFEGWCAPEALMTVLEALVHEGCLGRREASTIERQLLTRVDARGAWIRERRHA